MPKLIVERFNKGLLRDWPLKGAELTSSNGLSTRRGDFTNAIKHTRVNPLNDSGFIQPSFTGANIDGTDASAVTTDITSWAVQSGRGISTNAAYGIGGAKIYKVIGVGYTDIVNNTPTTPTWPHAITNGLANAGDFHDVICAYQNIGGTNTYCLFYAYNSSAGAGQGYLGRYDITNDSSWGAGNSSDTFSALTTNDIVDSGNIQSVPRPMVLGTNKVIYVGSGYKIDSLDLTVSSGTVSANVLDIDRSFEIQSVEFYKGQLVVAAHLKSTSSSVRGKVAVYFWDTLSPSFDDPVYIDDDSCGQLRVNGDDLYLFTANSVYGSLRQWNGRTFETIQQLSAAIPAHGGVDSFRDGLVWGDSSGSAWWFGEVEAGAGQWLWNYYADGSALTCVRRLTPSTDILHYTGNSSGTSFIRTVNTTYQSGVYYFPASQLPHRSTIKRVTVDFQTLASGADVTVRYLLNGSQSFDTLGTITYASDGAVDHKVFNSRISNVDTIAFNFSWSGTPANQVKIGQVEVEYETPNTKQYS